MNSSKHLLNPVSRRPDLLYNRIRRRYASGKTTILYLPPIQSILDTWESRTEFSSFLSPRKTK